MPLKRYLAAQQRMRRAVVAMVCLGSVWLLDCTPGQAQDATVAVLMTSVPPFEELAPDADLATVTLTVLLGGKPLSSGHLILRMTAPPRAKVLTTDFPHVEGTPLLQLAFDVQENGTFSFQYVFPIRGFYTFDLDITPLPGGPAFRPTNLRQTIRLYESAAEVRNAWLLVLGLFLFGVIVGIVFARSAAAREQGPASALIGSVVLLCSLLVPGGPVSAAVAQPAAPVVTGTAGWELEVRSTPATATVGQMVELAIGLKQEGAVFPGMMEVTLEATGVEEGQTVLQTTLRARTGQTVQRLQLFDGAPHTVTVTARPVGTEYRDVTALTAVLPLEVQALHPPMAVKLRLLAILLVVLSSGMVVGFFCPWRRKGLAGA